MTHPRARRASAAAAALILGAGAFAACSTEVPTVPEAPSPEASTSLGTSALPTPTPTPEAAPTNDPADPDSWVVTEHGIGPVEVAADYDDALKEIRASGIGPLDCDGVAYGYADDNAYDIMIIKDRDDSDDVVEISVGWNGDTMGVGPRTEEDLGLGSTKSQVLGTYDSADESSSAIADRTFVTIADDDGAGALVFTYLDGYDGAVSVSVISGEEPAYEPCA
ncbi:hypothetical protein [Microbacterium karelineae]|uniref:hypothetical protein n=1 Tax=Microbacterium karelineae TaxID=2654283 RepID=UPI0012E9D8A1|nr:hypothetical protein [Microbacterium karelineae]